MYRPERLDAFDESLRAAEKGWATVDSADFPEKAFVDADLGHPDDPTLQNSTNARTLGIHKRVADMDEQKRRPKKSINRFAYLLVLVGLPAFNLGCMSHSFCQPYGLNRFLQKEPSVHERAAVHFGPPTLHGYHPTTWQLWPGTWVAEPVLGEEVEEIAPGPAPDEMPDEMGPPVDETAPAPMYPDPPMPSDFPLLPESPLLPLPEDDIDEQSMSPGNDEAIADQLVNHLRQQREQGDLRGFLIDLEVMEGTVKLEGHVTKPNHIKTISQIARDIPGVREVVMDVRISP